MKRSVPTNIETILKDKEKFEEQYLLAGDEFVLASVHYTIDSGDNYEIVCGFQGIILPLTGLVITSNKFNTPLPEYNYCPDQRIYTFRRLSKDSPGLPPPSGNFYPLC